jgi:2-dehydro-3-deoxyphosphooctonate aldolase (KDO 8-P synthase)
VLQIPAFLCRQTDLLVAAARTQKWVNVKKGQFLSGESMRFAVDKIRQSGNDKVMTTDRGNFYGYNDLVVDYRNIVEMKKFRAPVIMDCTHSLQQPNQAGGVTGGRPDMIGLVASCAIAAGADGLFIETHPDVSRAKSDGANMLPLNKMRDVLERCLKIRKCLTAD